ncbi:MAG TPA: ferrous iron transporter B, partial [Mycobacteriales bacterium]|nr:ferrous iron transporter B [Mycobacteriales bacterium]
MTRVAAGVASASPSAPSCHAGSSGRGPARAGSAVVALAGAPNAGKSTLFNVLTGARGGVGNWPGTTVAVGRGAWRLPAGEVELVDLPGAYSLDPVSPDEELTRALLVGADEVRDPDAVVVTVDAAHLSRSLYLVAQLREHPRRVVLAVTMGDVATRRGLSVDADALSAVTGVPVVLLDPRRRRGTAALAAAVQDCLASTVPPARSVSCIPDADDLELADERYRWIGEAVDAAVGGVREARRSRSDRVDRWVTSPVVGPLVFLAAMWAVFEVTTTAAAPLQDALDRLFAGPVRSAAGAVLDAAGLAHTPVHGFVLNGLVAGVGMLLTFLPLMALMFLQLALLEDSGYLARAAVVTDRLMRSIGLPGRAFLPLVVGFGCNVPAIAATRVLPNARHRILTALLVPFTSCSARLTVYVLVASTFFPRRAGTVVFCMYVVSVALVVLVSLLLRSTLWRAVGREPLVLDLPPYQGPTLRLTAVATWVRVRGFLRTASGIIVATVCLVWLLQAIPATGQGRFGHVPVTESLYAATARGIAPVFDPAGFGEWRT